MLNAPHNGASGVVGQAVDKSHAEGARQQSQSGKDAWECHHAGADDGVGERKDALGDGAALDGAVWAIVVQEKELLLGR